MYRKNLKKMQTQTQEILSCFGSCDLRPVPKQPAWDFPNPDFNTPQNQLLVHHLTKQPLPNLYNSSLHQEDNNSLDNDNESYKSWIFYVIVNKVSYRWTLRILYNRIRIKWRIESRNKFFEKQNFWTEFWTENLCFELVNSSYDNIPVYRCNQCQLGKLSTQI